MPKKGAAPTVAQVMGNLDAVLPTLINLAEDTLPAGSGEQKRAAVVGSAAEFLASLGTGAPPELVVGAMEEQLAKMKAAGTLGQSGNPIEAGSAGPAVSDEPASPAWPRQGATFTGSDSRLH